MLFDFRGKISYCYKNLARETILEISNFKLDLGIWLGLNKLEICTAREGNSKQRKYLEQGKGKTE